MQGTKEADLVAAVLLYAIRCLAEGDQVALRNMRFGPQEIEALREDMRQSSEWARAELKRRRELREGSIVISPDNPVISGDNNPNG